jgi:hypothetical protein
MRRIAAKLAADRTVDLDEILHGEVTRSAAVSR